MVTLADFIKQNDPRLKKMFAGVFQTADGWRNYLNENFDGSQPVTRMINGRMNEVPLAFQALYIACWLHSPVEKGTYMIRLTTAQRSIVKAGYSRLKSKRMSSHLHKRGRSARDGWAFLKGYNELLVQMEGGGKKTAAFEPNLLLKCEGYSIWHPMHYLSWGVKLVSGGGATASRTLHDVARSNTIDGMLERGAENYSNKYKKVLELLGLKGKTQTVRDVTYALYKKLVALGQGDRLPQLGNDITDERPGKVADALDLILGAFNELNRPDPVKDAVKKADADFRTIIENLRADEEGSDRFFAEVKVTPQDLDRSIVAFKRQLED
ncbi:hypothetical protein [Polyangium aurulentum]|uniref:hypothetical protein n=1 Tax=Polyangium aurulentum TaxID=2567896 RepID=UPI0010ADA80D|nr:hypothetical protein [Polyangium aurulentum]UQA54911.1 hypothetical protein E8A73_026490 [Polyangium aurulentum]